MSKKIIKPEGQDLLDYLNSGRAICNECGAVMERKEHRGNLLGFYYRCPSCGWKVDEEDYRYDDGDPEPKEWTPEVIRAFDGDIPPAGCIACGGPYPDCKSSCKMFDD